MSYKARVFKVFVAAPSDVVEERVAVRQGIDNWNDIYSELNEIVFRPIGWDRNAAPEAGIPIQDYINLDLLDSCDLLIAIFWSRIGTIPPNRSYTGTIEEIERYIHQKHKLAMIYFCNRSLPPNYDQDQYMKLNDFRKKILGKYHVFHDVQELRGIIPNHLQIKINEKKLTPKHDSDILAEIQDDKLLSEKISEYIPNVSKNLMKKIIYEQHSDVVWKAVVEKLVKSPVDLRETLLDMANRGAISNYVFRDGSFRLSKISQAEFFLFMSNLYLINKYAFFELYHKNLLTEKIHLENLNNIVETEKRLDSLLF